MFRIRLAFRIVFAAALMQMAPGPGLAHGVGQFYQGRTINMIISAAPGGASDFFARVFAPYFAKHLAG